MNKYYIYHLGDDTLWTALQRGIPENAIFADSESAARETVSMLTGNKDYKSGFYAFIKSEPEIDATLRRKMLRLQADLTKIESALTLGEV